MRRAAVVLVVGLSVLVSPQRASGQSRAIDDDLVFKMLETLEGNQARVLDALDSLARQLGEIRTSLTGVARVRPEPQPTTPVSLTGVPAKGADDAPVVIVEYADFQCPFCGDFARQTLPTLVDRYVATGKVKFAFKNLPLQQIHPHAVMAAETAECAGQQGKFWAVHDALFSDQRLDETSLITKVASAGVDLEQFGACVRGPGAQKVRDDLGMARSQGLSVTPTFLIGRRQADGLVKIEQVVTGVKDIAAFDAVLRPLLDASTTN